MKKPFLQLTIQMLFLALFVFLFLKGKVQIWMGLLMLGVAASFIFGRIYCGWICSINTVLVGVSWFKRKLHIKSLAIPEFFKRSWVRYLAFSLFIIVFIFTITTGKKLPVLPALFGLGILLTILFPAEVWHRYICPYGTLLRLSSAQTKHGMQIDEGLCNSCGACQRVCPAKAIAKPESKPGIKKPDCLICMKCSRSCIKNAISYH